MGLFTRPRSPYWWLYLETTRQKEKTQIVVGTTTTQKRDSRRLADERYHQRMNEIAARLYRLPSAQPAIRFAKYAEVYARDVIPHRRGAEREQQLLKALRRFFDDDLLTAMDQDRVRQYLTHRKATASARTVNREVDLLKSMLRDAAPKYLAESPLKGMKRLRVVPPKRRLMTRTEERRLLAVCDATDRALVLVAVDGLVRLGDLLDLRRSDRRGRWLYIADPKSGEPYEVCLTARAGKALDRVPDYGTPYYFAKFRRAANPRDWPGSVRQRLETLCRTAHLPYGRAAEGLTFHWATRRTGATRLIVDRRASIPAVQRQGNWKKPDTLLAIYTEADRKAQQQAIALPRRAHSRKKRA